MLIVSLVLVYFLSVYFLRKIIQKEKELSDCEWGDVTLCVCPVVNTVCVLYWSIEKIITPQNFFKKR